jgi:hypothetical protein
VSQSLIEVQAHGSEVGSFEVAVFFRPAERIMDIEESGVSTGIGYEKLFIAENCRYLSKNEAFPVRLGRSVKMLAGALWHTHLYSASQFACHWHVAALVPCFSSQSCDDGKVGV